MIKIIIKKPTFLAVVFLMISLSSLFNIVISAEKIEFEELTIIGPSSESKTHYELNVWILGVWQYVNITLNEYSNEIALVFYYGTIIPDEDDRDETNYYFWRFKQGNWNDEFHGSKYIKKDFCSYSNNIYSFYIGTDQWTISGNWTLRIYSEAQQIHAEEIFVENAVIDPGLINRLEINIEPFTDDFYVSEEGFTVQNHGNIPLKLSVNYGKYSDLFETLDFDEVLKPSETKTFRVQLHSQPSWQPGEVTIPGDEIKILFDATDFLIPSKRVVNILVSKVESGLPIKLHIGHLNYTLGSLTKDIYLQYEKEKSVYYNEVGEILAYVSGEGEIIVEITSENLEIISIYSGGSEVGSHFSVISKNNSEYSISITFKGLKANTTGKIHYDLETGGVHNSFYTTIKIGSIRPTKVTELDLNIYIEISIIFCIILVLIYMLYIQLKHKKIK